MADDFDAQKRIAEREAEIEQLQARLFDLEVQRDAAAGMWMHYKAIAEGCICRSRHCQHGARLHHNGVCEICNAGICWC